MTQEVRKVHVIRSNRKSIRLQIDENLRISVRVPRRMSDKEIERFLEEKSDWIEKHMQRMKERLDTDAGEAAEKLTEEEIKELAKEARSYLVERTAFYAGQAGVNYGRITIRNQKSRWGSCSSRGNLNFNCLLMLTPPEIIDYVVVHELCHRLEMNHSARFWQEVEKIMPDYKIRRKWLKENGERIMRRAIS